MKKVVIGMSGGVDSSVAAYLLEKWGYEVIGISLKLYPEVSRCCRPEDIEDAKKVAQFLNIPHYVLDYTEMFKKEVVDYFAGEYLSGRTPNPCAICNLKIKFGLLLNKAKKMGADYFATGHYANILHKKGEPYLAPAKDREKSQEYFLSLLPPEALKYVIFPLAELNKGEVKEIALKVNLPLREKRESQDVCFVGEGGYIEFLRRNYKIKEEKGLIIDSEGNLLGKHTGYIKYTIGQRKGLGISSAQPLYVIKIIPERNLIIAGKKNDVYHKTISVKPFLWRGKEEGKYKVKIRYNHKLASAEVFFTKEEIKVNFERPQFAPTPGQLAAFYDDEYLLIGSGFIK